MKKARPDKKPTQEEINDYFNYSESLGGLNTITNGCLACKDCEYALTAVAQCRKFQTLKPGKVLYGKQCEEYRKRKTPQ